MRYAVVRTIHSPTAGDVRSARLVLADVPDKTSVAAVAEALTQAGRAGEFSEGGVPFGNHEIRAEGRAGWPKGIAGIDQAPSVTWARLVQPPTPAEGRRITLRLTPAEHDRFTLAAQRAGVSLQTWCMDALAAAADLAEAGEYGRQLGAGGRAQAAPAEAAS